MLITGEILAHSFTVKFRAARDADQWTVCVTDPWHNRTEATTAAASPYFLLDQMFAECLDGCRTYAPARAPRPALKSKPVVVEQLPRELKLGPKRPNPIPEKEAANG